uniref:Uncharacterized protein n=1 Tax=Glossina austeni TaxID=7395 RepID=A0A1A9VMG2_GLOAU
MNSRNNFLDADNSSMERKLRFVQNDFEDNLNQYFRGSRCDDSHSIASPPPRDYKIVQPRPGILDRYSESFAERYPCCDRKSSSEATGLILQLPFILRPVPVSAKPKFSYPLLLLKANVEERHLYHIL